MQAILPPGPKEKDQIDEAKQIKINECPCVLYTNFVGQLKIVGSYGGIDGRNVEGVARGVVGRGGNWREETKPAMVATAV